MPPELLHLPVKLDEVARAEARQREATVMTVTTGRCGCLLGSRGNKMKVDRKQREVIFFS